MSDEEFKAEEPALLARPRALRERLQSLAHACPGALLCDGSQIVPGDGNPHAEVVLVGEAPGQEEDRLGRPFVGRSGKLLESLLRTAGLDRRDLWITNVVKCRPVTHAGDRLRNRAPKTSEVKLWQPCLDAELALIRPKLVVGLGAVAGKALLGPDFTITRGRGTFHTQPQLGAAVIVSWHPAYLLRQTGPHYQARMAEAVRDFEAVFARLQQSRSRIAPEKEAP